MSKTLVYSWRLSAGLKSALEREARRVDVSMAELLDRIAREWMAAQRTAMASEEEEVARIRSAAEATFGRIQGDDPSRSANVRRLVRKRLARRRAS